VNRNIVNRVSVGDILTRGASIVPDKPAVIYKGEVWAYKQLEQASTNMAKNLLDICQQGDTVAILSRNNIALIVSYFACAKAGLLCAPMNLGLKATNLVHCIKHSKAKILIGSDDLLEEIREVDNKITRQLHVYKIEDEAIDVKNDDEIPSYSVLLKENIRSLENIIIGDRDPVQLLYTSGTTSEPKGVVTSHLAVTLAGLTNALCYHYDHNVVTLSVLPLYHCAALNCFAIPTLLLSGTLIITNGFEVNEVLESIDRYNVTNFVFLPMMYSEIIEKTQKTKKQYKSVKDAIYAMAPMPKTWLENIHNIFPNALVVLSSGQSEYTPAACIQREEEQWSKAESWGKATALTQIAIMREDGRLAEPGQSGEIVYRGPLVMSGYWLNTEATEKNYKNGWYRSGDIGWIDEENTVWFSDRKKDVIKSGGENVSSVVVERCLMAHPDVETAAVIGVQDEKWGEAVTAYIIPRAKESLTEYEINIWAKKHLARYEVPKRYVFVDELPMTATGKIQKAQLRKAMKKSM